MNFEVDPDSDKAKGDRSKRDERTYSLAESEGFGDVIAKWKEQERGDEGQQGTADRLSRLHVNLHLITFFNREAFEVCCIEDSFLCIAKDPAFAPFARC